MNSSTEFQVLYEAFYNRKADTKIVRCNSSTAPPPPTAPPLQPQPAPPVQSAVPQPVVVQANAAPAQPVGALPIQQGGGIPPQLLQSASGPSISLNNIPFVQPTSQGSGPPPAVPQLNPLLDQHWQDVLK